MKTDKFLPSLIIFLIYILQDTENASLSSWEQKQFKSFIEGQGLYSTDDDIEILTAHNFKQEIYNKNFAWIVEFYNSWCGFCQKFAPSWKALGTDIKHWNDVIKVGAIDCSDEDNNPVCRDFEIMAYPNLRYFHENYEEGPSNIGLDIPKGEDVSEHKRILLQTLINEQKNGRGTTFPDLQPFKLTTLSQLKNSVPDNSQYIFVIFQNESSTLGAEVILDFHKLNNVAIKYVMNSNLIFMNLMTVTKVPALYVFKHEHEPQFLGNEFQTKEDLKDTVVDYLKSEGLDVPKISQNKDIFTGRWLDVEVPDISEIMQEREQQALRERVKRMGDVVFQMDLETALRYSLKHEVCNTKTLRGEKLEALKKYLMVLAKYFPFGRNGRAFLAELRAIVEIDDASLSTSELYDTIKNAENEDQQIYSSAPQWLGCQGSSPQFRGYPCGLWKMFHYLTVNAAEQNTVGHGQNPREVLDAMHGYIKHFFGCADCSQHFQEMAERKNMKNVSSYDSSILWLWMAHNDVNKRLANDQTEDPEYPKIQFPSTERCLTCHFKNGSWNFLEVLTYLKHMYSSINVRYIGSDTRILHLGLEGASANSGAGNVFKTLDTKGIQEEDVYARRYGESLNADAARRR